MARTRTLAELRTDVEERADLPPSTSATFIKVATMNRWINQSIRRFMQLVMQAYGDHYFVSGEIGQLLPIQAGVDTYSLPADFISLLYVRLQISDSQIVPLERMDMDRVLVVSQGGAGWSGIRPTYRLLGNSIQFHPIPSSEHLVLLGYVGTRIVKSSTGTTKSDMTVDTDTLDGVNGWEEWVVLDAAIKCMKKEESDPSLLMVEQKEIEQEIVSHAQQRDQGTPARVRNTYDGDTGDRGRDRWGHW
jgi:hypothetical protein